MRAILFLMLCFLFVASFLWVTLSGASLAFGLVVLCFFLIITISYSDTLILFLLGAREVSSSDQRAFFEAASQEAYKLSIKMPRLYFYNGSLERAFVLQNRNEVSLILDKSLLDHSSSSELTAICFELLLQVKKGMAPKRTKSMFIVGFVAWIVHSCTAVILKLLPFADVKRAISWSLTYLLQPVLELLFKLLVSESYFKKLENSLSQFPYEKELIQKVGLKLKTTQIHHSLPSRKLLELSSIYKSRQFQNMMVLEFLPHEWDFMFNREGLRSAE